MTTASLSTSSRSTALSRIVSAPVALAVMVTASAVVQTVTAFRRATIAYLPDEFLYPQLARSIGHGDGAAVLGQGASLPAMLEPLLTAGFWSLPDAAHSIHLTQAFHSIVMSLAAIPVYLLARQLRLTTGAALTCSLVALVSPGMLYASYMTADAVGYLLALVAIDAGVRACSRPSIASQSWFLAAAGLATFTRLQYVTLFPAFAIAAIAVERYRPLRAARRFRVVTSALVLAAAAGIVGGGYALGRYEAILGFGFSGRTLEWTLRTGALLLVVAGAAITPGALAWALTAATRVDDRARAAFATLTVCLTGAVVLAAAIVSADTFSDRFLERYLLFIYPLVAIGFFCWIDEGRPGRVIAIATCCVIIIAAARVPVAGDLLGQGSADSPTLRGLSRLGGMIGLTEASLVAALVVTVCASLALVAALGRRIPAAALVAPAVILLALGLVGAHSSEARGTKRSYANVFATVGAWVEAERPGPTLLVQTPDSSPYSAMVTTVWNPSVVKAAPLGRTRIAKLDGLDPKPISAGRDGILRQSDGRVVREAVLVATGGSEVVFADTARVVRDKFFTLAVPQDGPVRLRGFAAGVRSNGTVASAGWVTAYPDASRSGRCTTVDLRLTLPAGFPPTTLEIRDGGGKQRTVRVHGGRTTIVAVTSSSSGPRTIRFRATKIGGLAAASANGTLADGMIVTNVARGSLSARESTCERPA